MNYKKMLNESVSGLLILEAGGQDAGKMEIGKTPLDVARAFAEKNVPTLNEEIPNFDKNYKLAQAAAKNGRTKRKDMPVITDADVKDLQSALKTGKIDISKPFGKHTDSGNPYPEGLKGQAAKEFLDGGLALYDGNKNDDKVKVKSVKVAVKDLKPIQEQIYADKAIKFFTFGTIDSTRTFLSEKSFFIISSDNQILDGHHRYLAAMLLDPNMKVNCLQIDLPIETLLKVTLAYGDAIGNSRNA